MYGLLKMLLPACLFAVAYVPAAAQQDSNTGFLKSVARHARFQTVTNVGYLTGQRTNNVQLQAIAGVQYKNWFAGAGAGLDYYMFRGVPLFLDVRKLFHNPMFLYTDAGVFFPMVKNRASFTENNTEYKKGLAYDVGAGWRFNTGRRYRLLLSAGYTAKQVHELIKPTFSAPPPASSYMIKTDYNLRCISVKAGFQF